MIDSEICCKLLSKQQFSSSPLRLLHYYFCNSSFDLLRCIFLIWLALFIWGCSVVTNIPNRVASHWSDVRMTAQCTQVSSLTIAAVRQLLVIRITGNTYRSPKESGGAKSSFLPPEPEEQHGALSPSSSTSRFFPLLGVQEKLGLVESPGQQPTRATSKISNLTVAILIHQPALPTPVAELGFPGLWELSCLYTPEKEG